MSDPDILTQLSALDEQRESLLSTARARRVAARQELAELDRVLGPSAVDEPAKPSRKARDEVTAAVRDAIEHGVDVTAEWASINGYNAASVARAVRKAKAA